MPGLNFKFKIQKFKCYWPPSIFPDLFQKNNVEIELGIEAWKWQNTEHEPARIA